MTSDKLNTILSANAIMAQLINRFQQIRLITSSTDKHYSLDSEDDFRSGCRNVSHQQQFFSVLFRTTLTPTITQYEPFTVLHIISETFQEMIVQGICRSKDQQLLWG